MPEHQQIQQSTESKSTVQKRATPIIQTPISNPMAIIQRARINPKSLTHADVMQLQRTIGNRAVGRLFSEIGLIPSTDKQTPPVQRQELVQRQEIPEKKEPLQGMFEGKPEEKTCPSCMQRQEIPEEEEPLQGKLIEPIQRQEIPEEEEPLQGKFENKPKIACPSCFASPIVQRQERPEEEEPLQGKFETVQRQEIPEEEEPLQPKKENNTGMPDNLKAGLENLSGIDMSDVRVHYNSSKPADVGALAYTQGTNIHVAPGQEKHLPHEGWHVVQQAQDRVQPTMQMKDGVPVNDDEGLEREADEIGIKSLEIQETGLTNSGYVQQEALLEEEELLQMHKENKIDVPGNLKASEENLIQRVSKDDFAGKDLKRYHEVVAILRDKFRGGYDITTILKNVTVKNMRIIMGWTNEHISTLPWSIDGINILTKPDRYGIPGKSSKHVEPFRVPYGKGQYPLTSALIGRSGTGVSRQQEGTTRELVDEPEPEYIDRDEVKDYRRDLQHSLAWGTRDMAILLGQKLEVGFSVFIQDGPIPNALYLVEQCQGTQTNRHLYYQGGNHYQVIVLDEHGPLIDTATGNRYSLNDVLPRVDGSCLYDGVHIVATGKSATEKEIKRYREIAAIRTSNRDIEQELRDIHSGVRAGRHVGGLGPRISYRMKNLALEHKKSATSEDVTDDSLEQPVKTYKYSDFEYVETFDSGSTKPEHVKICGKDKVLKFGSLKDPAHIQTEILTQKLYEQAGIPTLPAEYILVDKEDGSSPVPAQLTDYVKFEAPNVNAPDVEVIRQSPDFYRHVGADMVFSNWDLFKHDNWMIIEGRLVRADVGGALDRRAQGDKKEDFFKDSHGISEFRTMREKAESKNPYKRLTDQEIADSIRTLVYYLTPERIMRAMKLSHYPEEQREQMFHAILIRLERARLLADKLYPIESTHGVRYQKSELSRQSSGSEPEVVDVRSTLEEMGYRFKEFPLDWFRTMVAESRKEESGIEGVGVEPFCVSEDFLQGFIIALPQVTRSDDVREKPPLVGPEELFRESQFGGGLREKRKANLARMKTGRLIRRMSDAERRTFIQAAQSKDITEIENLLFATKDKAHARGEIVFSVNDPYIFDRDRKAPSLEKMTTEQIQKEQEEESKYRWIMEIPITDEMLQFLDDYAYFSNPHSARKPTAFMGNPNLKNEGEAGGTKDALGLPNVVIKKQGFEDFWSRIKNITFVLAKDHLWKFRSDYSDILEAKKREEYLARQNSVRRLKTIKRNQPQVDPLAEPLLFGDE